MSANPYRPDIDGLRAVAVLLVMLFHTKLAFSGGFVGVDVFFVISGFLITGQVIRELDAGEFSLANFWARRIRRLLPAATVMVVCVLIAGYFLLLPADYVFLGRSAIAQHLLSANLYFRFWSEFGYFHNFTEENPLLHTWSLAVEEQFYLLYPLLLAGLHRWGRRTLVTTLAGISLVSLLGCEWTLQQHPESAYYLLPWRAWELLLGGLVALCPPPRRMARWCGSAISVLGVAAILLCSWRYRPYSWFPGLTALPPCLATAALVHVNSRELSPPALLLASRPLVLVGLMSYSLYLWHWPLLAFYHYWNAAVIPWGVACGLLGLGLVLGGLSWWLIERPCRRWGAAVSLQTSFVTAGAALLGSLCLAGLILLSDGWSGRLTPQVRNELVEAARRPVREVRARATVASDNSFEFGDREGQSACLLWGDSHAGSLALGLETACLDLEMQATGMSVPGTPPLLQYDERRNPFFALRAIPGFRSEVVEMVRKKEFDVVILAGKWSMYVSRPNFEQRFRKTVSLLTGMGAHVLIVKDVPRFPVHVPRRSALLALHHRPRIPLGIPLESHRMQNRWSDDLFERIQHENPQVHLLDLSAPFRDGGDIWWSEIDGQLLFGDTNHLSGAGSRRVAPVLKQALEEALQRKLSDSGNRESGSREPNSLDK